MQTISIRADDIEIGERHRALSSDAVQRLATSMKDIGLKQPISIRVVDEMEIDGEIVSGVPVLVAGAHRLAAAKELGWSHIDCIEVEGDAITAEMWEIAENLHRCDLSKEQRDQHIRRYAELIEARRAEEKVSFLEGTKTPEPRKQGRPKSVAGEIVENTGLSKQTVLRALNNQNQRATPVAELTDQEVIDRQVNAVMCAWNKASPEARAIIRDLIDTPIMDARYGT